MFNQCGAPLLRRWRFLAASCLAAGVVAIPATVSASTTAPPTSPPAAATSLPTVAPRIAKPSKRLQRSVLRQAKPRGATRRERPRAGVSEYTSTGRFVLPGNLHCGVGELSTDGIYATSNGYWVLVTNVLYRWTGTAWSFHAASPTVYARGNYNVGSTGTWYYQNGTRASWRQRFTTARGYAYHVVQEIAWMTTSGTVVERVRAQTYWPSGNGWWYCWT
jgi:hypothetical protein